jgi:hypothetical protein
MKYSYSKFSYLFDKQSLIKNHVGKTNVVMSIICAIAIVVVLMES